MVHSASGYIWRLSHVTCWIPLWNVKEIYKQWKNDLVRRRQECLDIVNYPIWLEQSRIPWLKSLLIFASGKMKMGERRELYSISTMLYFDF